MKNVLTLCAIVLLCHLSTEAQDCFSNAGEDIRTCSFQDTLIGSPSGGEWLFPCIDSSQTLSMEVLNDSSVVVTYLECGTYTFEYSIDNDSCFAVDYVSIDFENPSTANYKVGLEVDLKYEDYECQESESTSCSNTFQSQGVAPKPLWTFSAIDPICSSTIYTATPIGNIDSCIADSIFVDVVNHTGGLNVSLINNLDQGAVVELDSTGTVIGNNYFNLIDQTHGAGVNGLINECPPPITCHGIPIECIDTTYFDTIMMFIPVHLGGYWTVFADGNFIELDTNYNFSVDSINYWLNVQPSIESYNAYFALSQVDSLGDPIPITDPVDLTLKWEEVWTLDTIMRIETIQILKDSCCRGGSSYNKIYPPSPPIPSYDCPEFSVTFIPPMITSDPIVICGDSTYVVEVNISSGVTPYDFSGIEGSITGGVFTSDPIPFDSVYFSFDIFDSGNCNDLIEGDNCACLLNGNTPIVDLLITEDCGLDGTGALNIESIAAGFAPYQYSLEAVNYQTDTFFQELLFGDYTLFVQDSFTCVTDFDFIVDPLEWIDLENIEEEVELCGNAEELLELPFPDSLINEYFIEWDDGDTSTFRTIGTAGTYILTVYELATCQKFQVTYEVEDLYFFDEDDIKIPNAFTPNGDGLNDNYSPLIDDQIEVINFSLGIFNRWGNRVFYSKNPSEEWNPNQENSTDVYVYFLNMEIKNCDGEIIFYKRNGDLTLIR